MPTRRARAMQALSLLAWAPMAETRAAPHSSGLRTHRAPAEAMEPCCMALAKQASPQWILAGDLRACCDEWRHDWLLAPIPMDPAIRRKWVQAGYLAGPGRPPTEAGTPQGGIGSPVIAKRA